MEPYTFDEDVPPTIVKRTSIVSHNPYIPGRNSMSHSLNSSVSGSPSCSIAHSPYSYSYTDSYSHNPNVPPNSRLPYSPSSPVARPSSLLLPTGGATRPVDRGNNPYAHTPSSPTVATPVVGNSSSARSASSSSCDSFVLGSGGKPRPFKSRPTNDRPLKAKWERRRDQVKRQLLKTLTIPERQFLIDSVPACQNMVDTIREEVYGTLRAINEQYEKAIGKAAADNDRLPTLAPPAARDPRIQVVKSLGAEPVATPPPGHSSFRTAIQQRHRTIVSVMFVGLDSAKPDSQLELIILVTHDSVYVVSMAAVGRAAFTDGGLTNFFEDPLITKLSFDCRPDAEALWKSFRVRQQGIVDLQVLATLALSPAGQFMISRRTMFQRVNLDHFAESDTPSCGGAQLSLRDARYLIIAYFMFDFFEEEGRRIANERVLKVISGDYTKCHIRDF